MSNQNSNSLFSVVDFVKQAKNMYDFSMGRDTGFIEYMKDQGHFYLYDARDFVPYANKYLGR